MQLAFYVLRVRVGALVCWSGTGRRADVEMSLPLPHALKFDSPPNENEPPRCAAGGKRGDSCGQFSTGCRKLTRGG